MIQKQLLRFLADENLEYRIVKHLRKKGYDVVSVIDDIPSISDIHILKRAYDENRIIMTNDKDFESLVFLNKIPHKGIILFRFKNEQPFHKIKVVEIILTDFAEKLNNHFVLVEENKIRIR